MSKVAKAVVGFGVTGAAGAAGVSTYAYATSGGTIREKFTVALIGSGTDSNTIWESKWQKLKVSNSVIHSENKKLQQAKSQSLKTSADDGIRKLMQEGCAEIYDSKFVNENDKNFKDFKAYCSLWFSDKLKTFITDATTGDSGNNKWDNKLTSLNSYTKSLVSDLKTIRDGEERTKKESIKTWCDKQKEKILEKENSIRYANIKDICLSD